MVPHRGGVQYGNMIDDPLALVVAGIWLMAAGMYPVGFLFGACSDCCAPAGDPNACCCGGNYPSQLVITMQGAQNRTISPSFWYQYGNANDYEEWINCSSLNASYVLDFDECTQKTTTTTKAARYRSYRGGATQTLQISNAIEYQVTASYSCNDSVFSTSLTVMSGIATNSTQCSTCKSEFGGSWSTFAVLVFGGPFASPSRFDGLRLPSGDWTCAERRVGRTITWRREVCSTGAATLMRHVFAANGTYTLATTGGTSPHDITSCRAPEMHGLILSGCDMSAATVTATLQ